MSKDKIVNIVSCVDDCAALSIFFNFRSGRWIIQYLDEDNNIYKGLYVEGDDLSKVLSEINGKVDRYDNQRTSR